MRKDFTKAYIKTLTKLHKETYWAVIIGLILVWASLVLLKHAHNNGFVFFSHFHAGVATLSAFHTWGAFRLRRKIAKDINQVKDLFEEV